MEHYKQQLDNEMNFKRLDPCLFSSTQTQFQMFIEVNGFIWSYEYVFDMTRNKFLQYTHTDSRIVNTLIQHMESACVLGRKGCEVGECGPQQAKPILHPSFGMLGRRSSTLASPL
ncbi:hypothetical protein Tco_1327205 [Tanacetum coccineum]